MRCCESMHREFPAGNIRQGNVLSFGGSSSVASKSVRGTGPTQGEVAPGLARSGRMPGADSSGDPIAVERRPRKRSEIAAFGTLDVARLHARVEGGDVVAEARALDHRAVERQAPVGDQVVPHRLVGGCPVVGDGGGHRGHDVEASSDLPARSRPARTSGTTTSRM